jgi:hypothetical protein
MPLTQEGLSMDAWTIGLFSLGAFLAATALVRLMRARRDQILAELTAEAREEQRKKQLAEALDKKKKKKQAAA